MGMIVTGGEGVLASYVHRVWPDATLLSRNDLDVTGTDFSRLDGADVVLHLAAATDVDACELDPNMAFTVNAVGTRNIAAACKTRGATLIYISTAGVFNGPGPFTETDTPYPANIYGISKLAGELAARTILTDLFIVRSGWMMGGGRNDMKFVGKIRRQLDDGATEIRAVDDKIGSPTYALHFLQAVKQILEGLNPGVYHAANVGSVTRWDVATEVCRLLGSNVEVTAVSSDLFPLPAPRSQSEVITSVSVVTPSWQDGLAAYLKETD